MLLEPKHWRLCRSRARPHQPEVAQAPPTVGGRKSDSPQRGLGEGREGFSSNFVFGLGFSFPLFCSPAEQLVLCGKDEACGQVLL